MAYQYTKVCTFVVERDSINFLQFDGLKKSVEAALQVFVTEIKLIGGQNGTTW